LAEAREKLRERDAEIRGFEQRALESSLALKAKEVALADLDKDLTSARALHAEVDTVRAALDQRSTELAKALEVKDAALQRAEQKIVTVEARIAEQTKAVDGERAVFEERLAKLKEQLEAEQSARAFAEGGLQAARQERGSRRHDSEAAGATAPKEPPAPVNEGARDKIARLRG
jgi:crescentin